MAYAPGAAPALKGVRYTLDGGHKVGIVGRTGSGKTTTVMALFRLYPLTSGRVLVDGIDVAQVPLAVLRRRFAVVPQPAVFMGTLRFNLDPLGECEDGDIWRILKTLGLTALVAKLE